MKNVAMVLVLVAVFAIGGTAHAAVQCAPGDHKVWNITNTEVTSCISDAAWQASEHEAAQRQGVFSRFYFAKGSTVSLKSGITFLCPFWFFSGCVVDKALVQ